VVVSSGNEWVSAWASWITSECNPGLAWTRTCYSCRVCWEKGRMMSLCYSLQSGERKYQWES
jgi:hypothetical protein